VQQEIERREQILKAQFEEELQRRLQQVGLGRNPA
jgi:hypothetical protein